MPAQGTPRMAQTARRLTDAVIEVPATMTERESDADTTEQLDVCKRDCCIVTSILLLSTPVARRNCVSGMLIDGSYRKQISWILSKKYA